MRAQNVVVAWDGLKGLLSESHSTNCEHCGTVVWLTGPKATGAHKLTYTRRDGERHACQRVFCSSQCAKDWLS